MSGREDMDPAYAETMAGQLELLGHAVRRFLMSVHKEVGDLLNDQRPTTQVADRDDDDVQPDRDWLAGLSGVLRLRGQCAEDITGNCQIGQHQHAIHFDADDLRRLIATGSGVGSSATVRDPDQPRRGGSPINCARGEPCPAFSECGCSCEHYHLVVSDGVRDPYYGSANSRNRTPGHAGRSDFICSLHGARIERLVDR